MNRGLEDHINGFVLCPPKYLLRRQKGNQASNVEEDGGEVVVDSHDDDHGCLIAAGERLFKFDQARIQNLNVAHDFPITFAAYNHRTLTFITGANHGVAVWSALTGQLEKESLNLIPEVITAGCVAPEFSKFFLGDDKGNIRIFNYINFAPLGVLDPHSREVSALVYITKLNIVISGSWDRKVVSHNVVVKFDDKRSARQIVKNHTDDVSCIAADETLDLVATGSVDGTVILYDLGLGPALSRMKVGWPVSALSFLSPWPLLAIADNSGGLSVWYTRLNDQIYRAVRILNWGPREGYMRKMPPANGVVDEKDEEGKDSKKVSPAFSTIAGKIWSSDVVPAVEPKTNSLSDILKECIKVPPKMGGFRRLDKAVVVKKRMSDMSNTIHKSADGRHVGDGMPNTWNLQDKEINSIGCMQYDNEAMVLYTGDSSGRVKAWNLYEGQSSARCDL